MKGREKRRNSKKKNLMDRYARLRDRMADKARINPAHESRLRTLAKRSGTPDTEVDDFLEGLRATVDMRSRARFDAVAA